MPTSFEKNRSAKKLQNQIAEITSDYMVTPDEVAHLVDTHNCRVQFERELIAALLTGEVEEKLPKLFDTDMGYGRLSLFEDYIRDAVSRFVTDETL